MPSLTEVHLQNYRSFLDAKCRLSPVTAVIGANNAGKSNLLKGIRVTLDFNDSSRAGHPFHVDPFESCHHRSAGMELQDVNVRLETAMTGLWFEFTRPYSRRGPESGAMGGSSYDHSFGYYHLDADVIGIAESDSEKPRVHANGEGVTRVLQMLSLKKKKVFQQIEDEFNTFVPEVKELTFERADQGKWYLQVREAGLENAPVALSELSEGTRTILALLTIIHQQTRPQLILLEDIEHAIHPRGLAPLVETMRRMAKEHGVQFIFTTQSPYVLDCFQKPEYWDDVVIVEKKDGVSTLTNAKDRLVALGYEREMENLPLGDLWYSGALGGVAGPNDLWDEPKSKP